MANTYPKAKSYEREKNKRRQKNKIIVTKRGKLKFTTSTMKYLQSDICLYYAFFRIGMR